MIRSDLQHLWHPQNPLLIFEYKPISILVLAIVGRILRHLTVRFKSGADLKYLGKTMMKIWCALFALLAISITASQGQDYLDGGYAASGDYGDIGQYFTDPVFYSPGSNYASPGLAASGAQISRTKNVVALGSLAKQAKTATGKAETSNPITQLANVAGSWHFDLSDGSSIDMLLYQSGNVVFGQGNLTSAATSQWATSNGVVSANSVRLAVVPASGTMLYLVSFDSVKPTLGGSYTSYRADGQTKSGAARANRLA
jgi:hypothetical protein